MLRTIFLCLLKSLELSNLISFKLYQFSVGIQEWRCSLFLLSFLSKEIKIYWNPLNKRFLWNCLNLIWIGILFCCDSLREITIQDFLMFFVGKMWLHFSPLKIDTRKIGQVLLLSIKLKTQNCLKTLTTLNKIKSFAVWLCLLYIHWWGKNLV